MKQLLCATLDVNEAKKVDVECSFVRALPAFSIVGLASNSIQEAKDRVKSALLANGFTFPAQKITINLSPSGIKKSGTHFDLAIALAIAIEKIQNSEIFIFGELGLDGVLKDTHLIFPLILSLSIRKENLRVLIPKESLSKVANIPNITIYTAQTLKEAIAVLKEPKPIEVKSSIDANVVRIENQDYYYEKAFALNFSDVKSQQLALRGALISASGFHNIMLEGSAGVGKSMIAKRLRYILPPLSLKESLEIANIQSLNQEDISFKALRPFRHPHHSSTRSSIFGGGTLSAKIGEVALSHRGVLFFDELPHFQKTILEALREPLEDNKIQISRVNSKVEYKANFLFISAQNPCPCGNLLSTTKECRCSDMEIARYKNRLSEPLMDRIDLYIQMREPNLKEKTTLSSEVMFEQVLSAFAMQKERGQSDFNAKLQEREIEQFCLLDEEAEAMLMLSIEKLKLSFRAINKIKKVARTVADLEGAKVIQKAHILEAISYRRR